MLAIGSGCRCAAPGVRTERLRVKATKETPCSNLTKTATYRCGFSYETEWHDLITSGFYKPGDKLPTVRRVRCRFAHCIQHGKQSVRRVGARWVCGDSSRAVSVFVR